MTVEACCAAAGAVVFAGVSAELIKLRLMWQPTMFYLEMVRESLCCALQRFAALRAWCGVNLEKVPVAPFGPPALACTFRFLSHCRRTPEL